MIALLSLAWLGAFQGAMQVQGVEIIGDVSRFTDAQPSIQVNAPVA